MGLLTKGKPLKWNDSIKFFPYIKEHGAIQFANTWEQNKDRQADSFRWGDELEYLLVDTPANTSVSRLSLRSQEIQNNVINDLKENEEKLEISDRIIIQPEYGSFMIEATPATPYRDNVLDLRLVEMNMRARRQWIEKHLTKDERLLSLGAFPNLGCGNYTNPSYPPKDPIANSEFISDKIINPHPRFGALTENIRLRRGKNVEIIIPLYKDINTPKDEDHIYMDAMAFGMGCCCLQVTFQAKDLSEARHLYDQLAVLSPIMMALTAATPFLKGKISNLDVRWKVISQSVDDRNEYELGLKQSNDYKIIKKSRYDTIDNYLSTCSWLKPEYNDIELIIDENVYEILIKKNVDELLAKHIAHLFIRDPLVVFDEFIYLDDKKSMHHFETIQSTNWQNVRFKPPIDDSRGWRIEFRTMEIQITDFENAAFAIFVTLLSRAILLFGLNFYIPISKVDENFKRAHEKNAVLSQKFWWRQCSSKTGQCESKQMSLAEILCTGTDSCPGLLSVVREYLKVIKCDKETNILLERYLNFIERRARGEILTTASWLRNFVNDHPLYKRDSNLPEPLCRAILDVAYDISHGKYIPKDLLGDIGRSPAENEKFSSDLESEEIIYLISSL